MAIQQEFVALSPSHFNVKAFDCGEPGMNSYLARFAAKNMGLKLSMTWVLPGGVDGSPKPRIVGG